MRSFIILLLCLAAGISARSQYTLQGKVLTIHHVPVIGASVTIKGTVTATLSNGAGEFTIRVPRLPVTLPCSYVGYTTKEYLVTAETDHNKIKIVLEEPLHALEEVVVVGYAAEHKADFSASLSSAPFKSSDAPKAVHAATEKKELYKKKTSYSRILTAGELSDFKKWKLWGDYSSADFSLYSERWHLNLRERYCVQVQNSDRRPVTAQQVFLIDADNRDTIWSAVTDNTGKAELWSDFDDEDGRYEIHCGKQTLHAPKKFEHGVNLVRLRKNCFVSNDVDISFVVDATGSMGDEISYLQQELLDIINTTASKHKDVQLHLSSVFYRDHGDEYVTRSFPFSTDAPSLVRFIGQQRAGGGGDFPEAMEDALSAALENLSWTTGARSKILFLVMDAPPHDAARDRMKLLIRKAAVMGVRIVPVACSGVDKSTEYLMRCAALATNGSYIFLTDDSGVGNPHIKPTTDEFKVELLNELLERVINEMIDVPACDAAPQTQVVVPQQPAVQSDSSAAIVKVSVYPNPTTGRIVLESSVALKEIFITDFTGKLLSRVDTGNRKRRWVMHLSNYPAGTYLIRYFNEAKGWGSKKVILIH